MPKIREDLVGATYVNISGMPTALYAGDTIPDGVEVGDHLLAEDAPAGYKAMKKDGLEAEVAKRNADRAEDDQIVVGGTGKVADLIEALEADDAESE